MKKVVYFLNVPKVICVHVLGKNHSRNHRKVCGAILMVIGVAVAKMVGACHHYLEFPADLVGYALHGTGLLPFIEMED